MFKKIEHIGIAVKDIQAANEMFTLLSNIGLLKTETVEREGVTTSFFQVGESKIEFLEAQNPDSPIAKFIDSKGEGIHHIAFEVEDIESEMIRLQQAGFQLIGNEAKDGADNKRIIFLHPKSTNKILIELCQDKG